MRGVGEEGPSQVALSVKNLPAKARDERDSGLIPVLGRSPEGGNGNPLQYSCLGNPMDRGAWHVIVHRVEKESDITEATTHALEEGRAGGKKSSSEFWILSLSTIFCSFNGSNFSLCLLLL